MQDQFSPQNVGGVYLECGCGGVECDEETFEICERGLRFNAKWRLEEGTRYSVSLARRLADGEWHHYTAEATVVDCVPTGKHCHAITLFFLALPDDLRTAINDGSLIKACLPEGGSRMRRRG